MSGRRPILLSAGFGAVLALLLAACASTTSPGTSGTSGSPSATGANGVTVDAASVGILGTALVNAQGRTLYILSADKGGKVTCSGSPCTGLWPPLLVPTGGTVVAGSGVTASKLGTVKTPSGATQATYNKWPLYTYSGDSGSNQSNGQGINSFGGVWHPIAPTGQPIVGGPSTTPSSSGGYGY
jgi:predicted lipoprotein with Yx(FWY)xxD motif